MERSTGYGHGRLLENIQNTLKYMLYSKGHALRRLAPLRKISNSPAFRHRVLQFFSIIWGRPPDYSTRSTSDISNSLNGFTVCGNGASIQPDLPFSVSVESD